MVEFADFGGGTSGFLANWFWFPDVIHCFSEGVFGSLG